MNVKGNKETELEFLERNYGRLLNTYNLIADAYGINHNGLKEMEEELQSMEEEINRLRKLREMTNH